MEIRDRVCVVTGGASGIGRAMATRFLAEGAEGVAIADLDGAKTETVAREIGALGMGCDVSREEDVRALVSRVEAEFGRIDVFCSNAGIAWLGDEHAPNEDWQRNWDVHVMAHVYAARAVVPGMAQRGEGYLVNTASAAGLLSHVNSATYAVTKHAAVSLAEWLSIRHRDEGIRVSVLCPQQVRTPMTQGREAGVAAVDGAMEADEVADHVVRAMAEESFLILPHPQVLEYMRRKVNDYDRWLRGMRRLLAQYDG